MTEFVPKGTLFASVELDGATYLFMAEALLVYDIGALALDISANTMIKPWVKNDYYDTAFYKVTIHIYELQEDMYMDIRPVAGGKLNHYVLPGGEGKYDYVKMQPVCLAEPERYAGHEKQKLIQSLAEAYKDKINFNKTADGTANKGLWLYLPVSNDFPESL